MAAVALSLLGCGDDDAPSGSTGGSTGEMPTTDPTTPTTTPGTTDTTDGSTGIDPDSGSSDTGEPAFCPETHRCIPVAPRGWNGPVTWQATPADAEPAPCGAAYPDHATAGFASLVAPPAECTCSCEDPVGVICDSSMALRVFEGDPTCSGTGTTTQIFSGICNNFGEIVAANRYWLTEPLEASGGSCEPSSSLQKSEPYFETRVTVCSGAETFPGGCATNRVCAPRPEQADAPLCVWQAGEHECPAAYPEQRVLYGDWEDQRDCEACTCGPPVGLCDAAVVNLLANPCNPPVVAVLPADGQCRQVGSAVESTTLMLGQPNAFCTPSPGQPTGEAIGIDPVTLCCEA